MAVALGNILDTGRADLAVANQQANNVHVFPGVGGGFFGQNPTTYSVGQAPGGLFLGNFNSSGTGIATLNTGSDTISLIDRTGVIQTISAGGLVPTSGFAGDFTGKGFTDLVVGNAGDGRFSLFTGGVGGLTLSQVASSPAVPSPTALNFAGVLSYYATTAGREAATLLSFNLNHQDSGGGSPGGGSPVPFLPTPTTHETPPTGANVTFRQVLQLLGNGSSVLTLVAAVFTEQPPPVGARLQRTTAAAESN